MSPPKSEIPSTGTFGTFEFLWPNFATLNPFEDNNLAEEVFSEFAWWLWYVLVLVCPDCLSIGFEVFLLSRLCGHKVSVSLVKFSHFPTLYLVSGTFLVLILYS